MSDEGRARFQLFPVPVWVVPVLALPPAVTSIAIGKLLQVCRPMCDTLEGETLQSALREEEAQID